MRILAATALGLGLGLGYGAAPAAAQSLGDVGRQLKDQLLPGQNQSQVRDRNAYEQGRRDQEEQTRRQRESARGNDDRRGNYDDRRHADDRNGRGVEEADRDRRNSDRDSSRGYDSSRPRPLDNDVSPRSRY